MHLRLQLKCPVTLPWDMDQLRLDMVTQDMAFHLIAVGNGDITKGDHSIQRRNVRTTKRQVEELLEIHLLDTTILTARGDLHLHMEGTDHLQGTFLLLVTLGRHLRNPEISKSHHLPKIPTTEMNPDQKGVVTRASIHHRDTHLIRKVGARVVRRAIHSVLDLITTRRHMSWIGRLRQEGNLLTANLMGRSGLPHRTLSSKHC